MWNLLPDNAVTLRQWSTEYNVSANNPFKLLAAVGEDCPGAIQLITPGSDVAGREGVAWITEKELIQRIKDLRADPGATRMAQDEGRVSLAGAQNKTALYKSGNRWGVPAGRTPTTHILKPESTSLPGLAANEHFTLLLMRAVRLPAPNSAVMDCDGIPVFVTERYDRVIARNGAAQRIHQEDMCQALGLPPQKKYQDDGGPGIPEIMKVLSFSNNAQEDRDRFMRAQAFNMMVGNADAHSKNFSILFAPGGAFRLAPFYDVACHFHGAVAMTIGSERQVSEIKPRHWERTSKLVGYDGERAVAHVRDLIALMPGMALSIRQNIVTETPIKMPIIDSVIDRLWERVRRFSQSYGAELMAD